MTLWLLVTRPLVHNTGEASSTIHTTSPSAYTDSNTELHEHMHWACQAAAAEQIDRTQEKKNIKPGTEIIHVCILNPKWQIICGAAFSFFQSSLYSGKCVTLGCSWIVFAFCSCFYTMLWSSSIIVLCFKERTKKDVPPMSPWEAQNKTNNQVPKVNAAGQVFSTSIWSLIRSRNLWIIRWLVWPAITMEGV